MRYAAELSMFNLDLISLDQDLKLQFYDLMIQHALHNDSYLDAAKYYEKVWHTASIKEDVDNKGRTVRDSDVSPWTLLNATYRHWSTLSTILFLRHIRTNNRTCFTISMLIQLY